MRPAQGRPNLRLHAILLAIALAALLLPALVVAFPPPLPKLPQQVARVALAPKRVVPLAEVPPVEPMDLVAMTPEDARAFNATVPFVPGPNPAARPFRFAGDAENKARAVDCLAATVLYEAGDDAVGERAVAQVVLNRLRHPAFPQTICGVVFQGQERRTGCQFTFTCDGALARAPSEAAWKRAQEIATAALQGAVYKPVGYATHYHTDWVLPYWSSSLDKLAEVHTHLFFRWSGWWGTPPAFNRRVEQVEPVIPRLGTLSEAHRTGAALAEAAAAVNEAAALIATTPVPTASDANVFLVTLPAGVSPDQFPSLATAACDTRTQCRYSAWADPAVMPRTLPLTTSQVASMAFSYLRDAAVEVEKSLWNCRLYKRPVPEQCMKAQVYMPASSASTPAALPSPAATGLEPLDGTRRASPPTAGPAPSVTPGQKRELLPRPAAKPPRAAEPGKTTAGRRDVRPPETSQAVTP